MNKKLTFEQFAATKVPLLKARWEIYNISPKDLVGKKVVSIRAGFSSEGGQVMLVQTANSKYVHLNPTNESINIGDGHMGWGCNVSEIPDSFILYNHTNMRLVNKYINDR